MGIATTTASVAVRQLTDGSPEGANLGRSAADPIGFYGATPTVQLTGATSNVADTASTLSLSATQTGSTAGVGFSTAALFNRFVSTIVFLQADMQNVVTNLNAIHAALSTTGFYKGS